MYKPQTDINLRNIVVQNNTTALPAPFTTESAEGNTDKRRIKKVKH